MLVVVDPQELPRTWASVDPLGEQIGEGTYRAMPEDVAPDQSVTMGKDWGVLLKASVANLQQTASIKMGEVRVCFLQTLVFETLVRLRVCLQTLVRLRVSF